MRAYNIIMKKRDGLELTSEEIEFMVNEYCAERIPDYQMAAFLMAIYLKGMDARETADLTMAMLHSGEVVDLSSIGKTTVDKHSTGGVGDKVSLILAPVVAAAGIPVPMMSGRGLGHTGGTLDKLESIPGFRTQLSEEEFIDAVRKIGLAIIGQTKSLAPADKKMYALRDVTATVESIPLITGSILSKKLAAGVDALVMDVKTGKGAFMSTLEQASELARTIIDTAAIMKKKVVALITDMNQPLGMAAGNALEIEETVATLEGKGPEDLKEIVLALAGHMLFLGGVSPDPVEGRKKAVELLESGAGLKKFKEMVEIQGGDVKAIDDTSLLPRAAHKIPVKAEKAGFVHELNALEVGLVCVALGAGRETVDSDIDLAVGVVLEKKIGDSVEEGSTLAVIHANEPDVRNLVDRLRGAYTIKEQKATAPPLIYRVITT